MTTRRSDSYRTTRRQDSYRTTTTTTTPQKATRAPKQAAGDDATMGGRGNGATAATAADDDNNNRDDRGGGAIDSATSSSSSGGGERFSGPGRSTNPDQHECVCGGNAYFNEVSRFYVPQQRLCLASSATTPTLTITHTHTHTHHTTTPPFLAWTVSADSLVRVPPRCRICRPGTQVRSPTCTRSVVALY